MTYIVQHDGRIVEWPHDAPPESYRGTFVRELEVYPKPEVADGQIAEPLPLKVRLDGKGVPVAVVQNWTVLDMTPEELRFVIPPDVFLWQRLTADERATIRSIALQSPPVADLWDRLLTLKEGIISDDPLTAAAKAACTQVFNAERTLELFSRP